MRDICTQDTARDWRQRYENTVGKIVSGEKPTWVFINRITDTETRFSDIHGTPLVAKHNQGVVFEFTQVVQGWYQTSEYGPVYMCRVPQRQWQRGISPNNTQLLQLSKGVLLGLDVSLEVVSNVIDPAKKTPFNLDSFVMSRQFAYSGSQLYFNDQIAGKINNNTITLNGIYEIEQEVGDVIRRNNFPLELKGQ